MKLGKQGLTKNILSLSAVQIANTVLPVLSVPVISRILGPDKFGSINFAMSFVGYFVLLIGYGFDLSATRKIAKDPTNEENRNQVFSEVFYLQSLLLIVSAIIFAILLMYVPQLKAESVLMIFSFLVCISALFTQNWMFLAMQDMPKVAFFNLITKLLFTVLMLIFIRQKSDYILQPLIIGVIQIMVSIASFIWAYKKYNLKFVKLPVRAVLKVLWTERMVFFSIVVVSLYTGSSVFILGLFKSPEQVGYFTAGQRLIIIIHNVIVVPMSQALYPYIGKSFGESREAGIKTIQQILPVLTLICGMAVLGTMILGPYMIYIFYGEKFSAAVSVLQIMLILPIIIGFNNLMGIQTMLNLGMDKIFFKITCGGAAISLLLNFLMIERWGFIGTSYNWVITESLICICMYVVLRKKGINPIQLQYFKLSEYRKYYEALKFKIWPAKSNVR